MADINQFGSIRPVPGGDAKVCASFEAMLADAVDGLLTPEEQASFDLHLVGCASCREMLADAKRGAVWMEMLRAHTPEPPAAMLERILAQTSGLPGNAASVAVAAGGGLALGIAGAQPAGAGAIAGGNVLPFRSRAQPKFALRTLGHTLLQPRLAMTAAMAFFSIALTLNLTGVRLSEFRASDLKPANLKRTMYEANAHVVRYYTNLQIVYELESRVHDLQRSSASDTPGSVSPAQTDDGTPVGNGTDPVDDKNGQPPKQDPKHEPKRRVSPGTSRREPIVEDMRVLASMGLGRPEVWQPEAVPADGPRRGYDLEQQERGTV